MVRTRIAGLGGYIPEQRLTNQDLAATLATSDDWITSRTGIRERRVAGRGMATSDMAVEAARRALASSGMSAGELDMVVVATCTPDMVMPSTAALVQGALGAGQAACVDLNAACTGFVYGLHLTRGMIESGLCRAVLLVGADKMSGLMDYTDRNVCILFGDGAGAAVCVAGEDGGPGVLASLVRGDGGTWGLIRVPVGGSRTPFTPENVTGPGRYMQMQGREVFRTAVRCLEVVVAECLAKAGLTPREVDWVIPHQANARLVEAVVERTGFTSSQVIVNIDRLGNTSAASIPLAWWEAVESGRCRRGQRLLLAGMGAGQTWGAAVLTF
jgi:3-oxoacyl-[acyl-carrier-protein] synthase-3